MKLLSYLLSPIFAIVFFSLLMIFHPLQWIGLKLFGYKGHKFIVDLMVFSIEKSLLFLGIIVHFKNNFEIPKDASIIFVANHQSLFDIPSLGFHLRKFHPKFVSKIELGKGIPSVSFNLRHGGAALIDRKDSRQALTELASFAKKINKNRWSAVIFPEGTRSRNGQPKPFSVNGLKMITKYNQDGYIVPVTVNNSWKVFKYGKYPFGIGSPITFTTHKPIKIDSLPFKDLIKETESQIISQIK